MFTTSVGVPSLHYMQCCTSNMSVWRAIMYIDRIRGAVGVVLQMSTTKHQMVELCTWTGERPKGKVLCAEVKSRSKGRKLRYISRGMFSRLHYRSLQALFRDELNIYHISISKYLFYLLFFNISSVSIPSTVYFNLCYISYIQYIYQLTFCFKKEFSQMSIE